MTDDRLSLRDRATIYRRCADAGFSVAATAHIVGAAHPESVRTWGVRYEVRFRRPERGCKLDGMLRRISREACDDICTLIVAGQYPAIDAVRIALRPKRKIAFRQPAPQIAAVS